MGNGNGLMLLLIQVAVQIAQQKVVVDHGIVPVVVMEGHIDGIDKVSIAIVKNLDLKLKIFCYKLYKYGKWH
jgi:hypothetical protein